MGVVSMAKQETIRGVSAFGSLNIIEDLGLPRGALRQRVRPQ